MHEIAAAYIVCGGLAIHAGSMQKRSELKFAGMCVIIFATFCAII